MELADLHDRCDRKLYFAGQFAVAHRSGVLLPAGHSNTLVGQRFVTDPYAKSTNAIINADKAYKYGEVIPTAGTRQAPVNPCGG